MKVSEYRDLLDDVSDTLASCKSAATFAEMEAETARLQRKRDELSATVCPTAKPRDRARAERLMELCRAFISASLMASYDNQRIKAEYLGQEYDFVNPSRFTN